MFVTLKENLVLVKDRPQNPHPEMICGDLKLQNKHYSFRMLQKVESISLDVNAILIHIDFERPIMGVDWRCLAACGISFSLKWPFAWPVILSRSKQTAIGSDTVIPLCKCSCGRTCASRHAAL